MPAEISASANTLTSQAVNLFQKAHTRMVQLQRLDEQVVNLLMQRKKAQEDLRAIQNQINQEFDRLLHSPDASQSAAHALAAIVDQAQAAAETELELNGQREGRTGDKGAGDKGGAGAVEPRLDVGEQQPA